MSIFDSAREALWCAQTTYRLRGYKPQPVTFPRVWRWLHQFKTPQERRYAAQLLNRVQYLDEQRVLNSLCHLNRCLLERLLGDGLQYGQIIYIQIHDAGSSSPVMLNMLRNAVGLEKRGCECLDGKNVRRLVELTDKLGEGAVIYVDDFIGSGDQFLECRNFIKDYIPQAFSEFVLASCICEEGYGVVRAEGVEPFTDVIHAKAARPLHAHCVDFDKNAKVKLLSIAKENFTKDYYRGLGYKGFSTSVVLYSNAPDTTPLLFRGSQGQSEFRGILPRYSDLPFEEYDATAQ